MDGIGCALGLDKPGLREVAFAAGDGEGDHPPPFEGVSGLAGRCRPRNCTRTHEPGCAVKAAVAAEENEAPVPPVPQASPGPRPQQENGTNPGRGMALRP